VGNHSVSNSVSQAYVTLGSINVYYVRIFIFGIAVVLMMALSFWLSKTKGGKALRATAENLETASLLGINTKKMITLTVVIASVMGGIAGILFGMAFSSVYPQRCLSISLK